MRGGSVYFVKNSREGVGGCRGNVFHVQKELSVSKPALRRGYKGKSRRSLTWENKGRRVKWYTRRTDQER